MRRPPAAPAPQAGNTPPAPVSHPAAPPPQSSWLDGLLMPLLAVVVILALGYAAWRYMSRRNEQRPPDFRAKAPATGAPGLKSQAPAKAPAPLGTAEKSRPSGSAAAAAQAAAVEAG